MKRREFISLLGGAAAWPITGRSQQRDRTKRLGVLWGLAENDNIYESPTYRLLNSALKTSAGATVITSELSTGSQVELPSASASQLRNWPRLRQM